MDKRKISILISHFTKRRYNYLDSLYPLVSELPNVRVQMIEPEHLSDETILDSIIDKDAFEVLILPNYAGKSAEILLKHFKNIRWVQALGTGVEFMLAVDELAKDDDIVITNLKSVSDVALAEFCMLGALFFTKDIPKYQKLAENHQWDGSQNLIIDHLEGKRALIVGLGSIGREIAKKCVYGFSMDVVGVKRNPNDVPEDIKSILTSVETPDKLIELVQTADYVFAALPYQSEGYVITRDVIQNMKKGIVFVNVGRGQTVDEKALIEGLKTGIIKGAALDVFEHEPLKEDSPFYTDPELRNKVLNTCHKMDQANINYKRSTEIVLKNLNRFIAGDTLLNVIDKKKGY